MSSYFGALSRAARTVELWGGRSSEQILAEARKVAEFDGTDAERVLADLAHVFVEDLAALIDGGRTC